jgi:hypothetical protein
LKAPRRDCAISKVAIGANTCRRRPASTPTPIRNISHRHAIPRCRRPHPRDRYQAAGRGGTARRQIWLRQRGELETLQRLGKCDVLLVADAKELASLVTDLPADAAIDPTIEQQIDQQLGRLAEALTRRDGILAVLR